MTTILGNSIATAEQMNQYLLSVNPNPKIKIPSLTLCQLFLYMGFLEGVRGDILFAQSCKETGHFDYGGTVVPEQNNYSGLGTTNASTRGAYFPDEATGILAQAQHAKCYATDAPLNYTCVDPRYDLLVKYGKCGMAKHWEELGGTWAVPGYDTKKYSSLEEANNAKNSYGYQIIHIYEKILAIGKTEEPVVTPEPKPVEPIVPTTPTKKFKVCIDPGHHGRYNRCPGIPEYYESEVMWKLSMLQKDIFEKLGVEVIMTRTDPNKDLALKDRGMTSAGCDLFISNHSNAVGSGMNENVDYPAIFYLVENYSVLSDDLSKEIGELLATCIAETMGTKQKGKALTKKSDNDRNGDGIMNDNYYGVLHGAALVDVPGLILEHSFHTNSNAVRWLLNDVNLALLADAECRCILNWLEKKAGMTPTTTPTPATPAPTTPNTNTQTRVLYRVQVGAFSDLKNAQDIINKITAMGYPYTIKYDEVKKLHKVQVGAFANKANAVALKEKLKNAGIGSFIA